MLPPALRAARSKSTKSIAQAQFVGFHGGRAKTKNDAAGLESMARCFMEFCDRFGRHFLIRGKDSSAHARHYLSGLLGRVARKNIGRIGENVAESNYQGMQQFISDSPWDHTALLAEVARDAGTLLGGHRDSALYLDETSFVKKGGASVGVQRQYCGRLGKLENCPGRGLRLPGAG